MLSGRCSSAPEGGPGPGPSRAPEVPGYLGTAGQGSVMFTVSRKQGRAFPPQKGSGLSSD